MAVTILGVTIPDPDDPANTITLQPRFPLDEYDYIWFNGHVAGTIDPTDPNLTSPDFPDQTMTLVEDLPDGLYTVVVQNSPNADPYATDLCYSVALEFEIANEIDMDYTPEVDIVRHRTYCYDEFVQGLGLAQVTNDDFGEYSIEWNRVDDMGIIIMAVILDSHKLDSMLIHFMRVDTE